MRTKQHFCVQHRHRHGDTQSLSNYSQTASGKKNLATPACQTGIFINTDVITPLAGGGLSHVVGFLNLLALFLLFRLIKLVLFDWSAQNSA
ncbi:hypothetical protein [Aestuariispira insulae]|uniref:Uncharacterized protein n=1 Tax=Aestuariispira insulae TaxID=1461337 RepID=A0A3D9HFM5_9PROT|nr:hypothetical protein [Aestuariispira insulae]RED48051.1 hypothetical protein DFP90_10869 [Aestuariispira insulae]